MKDVIIVFVPTGVGQQEFEAALREHFPSVPIGGSSPPATPEQVQCKDMDEFPLWMWFLPRSCH
jgi:hypothetical protein